MGIVEPHLGTYYTNPNDGRLTSRYDIYVRIVFILLLHQQWLHLGFSCSHHEKSSNVLLGSSEGSFDLANWTIIFHSLPNSLSIVSLCKVLLFTKQWRWLKSTFTKFSMNSSCRVSPMALSTSWLTLRACAHLPNAPNNNSKEMLASL